MSDRTVAIIGASQDRSKFGNQSVRAHAEAGYQVFPVNPKGGTIEGWTVYASIDQVPVETLDRISLYLPPERGLAQLSAIAAKGCRELWLNPGTASPELVSQAEALGLCVVEGCSLVDCMTDSDPR